MTTKKKLSATVKALRRMSLCEDEEETSEEDVDNLWKTRAFSSYQKSYQPMAVGLRTTLWEDGFRQRVERKKGGFTHFKLEWIVPTFRGKSISSSPELSNSPDNPEGVEKLSLLPTKLEKKRTCLERLYDQKLRRLSKMVDQSDVQVEKSKGTSTGRSKFPGISDYERNRLNNMKSHFVLPTLVNSCGSSAKLSTTTSHSQRSVITAKFKPGYSSPKKAQRGRKLKDVKAEVSESKKQIEINGDKESKTPTLKLSKHDILVKDQEKSLQTQLK